MENIELSNQTSKKSYITSVADEGLPTSFTSDHYSDRGDTLKQDDDDVTTQHNSHRLSSSSMIPENEPLEAKKSFGHGLKTMIPPLPLSRAIVKASIAVLISLLFVFEENCRISTGAGSIMVPIGTILNFPIRPIGNVCIVFV